MDHLKNKDSLTKLFQDKPQMVPLDPPNLEYQFTNFKDNFLDREKDYQERGLATIAAKEVRIGQRIRGGLGGGLTEPRELGWLGVIGRTDGGKS